MRLKTIVAGGALALQAGLALVLLWSRTDDGAQEAFVQAPAGRQPPAAPLSIAVLFEFDSAALREAESAKLDALLRAAHRRGFARVDAEGHAGRIGPTRYNRRLSEQRAASIRDYLIGKDVGPDKVRTSAKGELASVSGHACLEMGPELRSNALLVRCLQADRRVIVSVITQLRD
jgi:OOP family OmpA-OmpF porin